jgi:hypothetical protein
MAAKKSPKSKPAVALPTMAELATVAPAPAAEAPKAKKTKAVPTGMLFISKDFKPRTNQLGAEGDKGRWAQQANWDAIVSAFNATEDGELSYADCVAAVQQAADAAGYGATANARGFVQGRIRGEHLMAVAA